MYYYPDVNKMSRRRIHDVGISKYNNNQNNINYKL